MKIRLTQIDGKLPNLALMKLAHWHRAKGDEVFFERSVTKGMFEPEYDTVYGSTIFSSSQKKVKLFKQIFPNALIGGTGIGDLKLTVEQIIGVPSYENYDYSIYPEFDHSIGFTQRGCRLRCSFCVVPKKEGKLRESNTISQLWRGPGYPKKLHLLDNDFFGQPNWKDRCQEIIDGNFKVCFNQGINVRLITDEVAEYLSKIKYYDDQFKKRRLYTAWDNKNDEKIFTTGVNKLLSVGIVPNHIMVYMLCGFWKKETFDDVFYRFKKMIDMGLRPYPMVYEGEEVDKEYLLKLKKFQRWVIGRYYEFIDWSIYQKQNEKVYYNNKSQNLRLPLKFDVDGSGDVISA